MAIYLASIVGSPSIGVYSLATDNVVIVPSLVPTWKAERIAGWLKVKLIHVCIGGSVLAGAFACANSNGILLPNSIRKEELEAIEKVFQGKITVMETKKNAYGNLVLANDKGAVVDPRLKESEIKQISNTLQVQAVPAEIAGLPYVGSLGVATNKGVLVHPLLKDSEREVLETVFQVPVDLGTINCGIPYVGTGLIGNNHTAVAGSMTTGPELFIIGHTLDVVQEEEQRTVHSQLPEP